MTPIAFHNGNIIPDNILGLIMDQASRGKMTAAASKLLLIPDRRKGRADSSGLQLIGRVRRSDCMTLGEYSKKRPTKSQKRQKTAF